MKQFITEGENLPAWSAPISHAVVVGDTCYLSGQLAIGRDGNYISGTGQEEARRAFQNIAHVLETSGFALQDMVIVDIAFIDLADLPEVDALFTELFPVGRRPARTIYQAARLPYDARIKVAGTAVHAAAGRVDAGWLRS
ncbi:RidA family protein [Telluria aromaticivorans]|uniref:RidA family protein n=1 Tax=Telluria aromaticivorans TaxID=2725995 RepID=A0A7Y2JZ33_9BURK|nr:RidA family protein [Telluria aromaticivorans]NNG23185.1 RidA family protein [Telluria aromaticivorans]